MKPQISQKTFITLNTYVQIESNMMNAKNIDLGYMSTVK